MAAASIWLVDPNGVYAQAFAKDGERLVSAGWRTASEPGPTALVWTRHEQLGTYKPFAAEILPHWQARGWQPAVPPMAEGDVGPYVDLTANPAPEITEKEKARG